MKKKVVKTLLILFTLTSTTSCLSSNRPVTYDGASNNVQYTNAGANKVLDNKMASKEVAPGTALLGTQNISQITDANKKIVKNGSLSLTVDKVDGINEKITSLIQPINGIVDSTSLSDQGSGKSFYITIKVPQDKYDEAINTLSTLGKVQNVTSSTYDVTLEYIDSESKLKTLNELEAKYKDLLSKTTKMEETLQIEEKLQNIRQQVDSATGQLNYLKNQTTYSVISISVFENSIASSMPNESLLNRFIRKLSSGVKNWGKDFVDLLVFLILILPILLLIYVMYRILKRLSIKRRSNKKAELKNETQKALEKFLEKTKDSKNITEAKNKIEGKNDEKN